MRWRWAVSEAPHRRRWHHRARYALRRSLRLRLVLVFLLLAVALTGVFLAGMQRVIGTGWRQAVSPLLSDYVDRLVADIGAAPTLTEALSDREREIALLAANGHTSKQIAEQLFVSFRTVNNHLQHVYDKLGARGRRELRTAVGLDPDQTG